MTMHPDDFENAYRRCETLTSELVKAFAAIRVDAPTIDETAGYADEIAHNLAFMRPQIDEMLRRREEEDTYRRDVAARMREEQAIDDWRAGRAA